MMWAWIFAGIAVAGLVMVICYAIWLWHKASDLLSEGAMLAQRANEAAELISQIKTMDEARVDASSAASAAGRGV